MGRRVRYARRRIMILGSLPNTDQNNLIPIGDETAGVTTEALTETDTAFSFNIHGGTGLTEGGTDLPDTLVVTVGLMERSGTDGPWSFTQNDCALWVKWTRPFPPPDFQYLGLPGTVTESWGSFGTTFTPTARKNGRSDVDVGYVRQGPRYTLGLEGANYVGYVDYHRRGGAVPRAIVSAPAGGFPFPLRLVMSITTSGGGVASPAEIRDIVLEGKLGEKATLTADNKTEWGVDSAHPHLRIYQLGIVPGFPVDIDL